MTKIFADGSGWSGTKSMWCVTSDMGYYDAQILRTKHTNNEMEYEAIIHALSIALPGDIIFSDSQVVVEQLAGNYQVKAANLKPLYDRAMNIKGNIKIEWIPRKQNLAGIALEKLNGD